MQGGIKGKCASLTRRSSVWSMALLVLFSSLVLSGCSKTGVFSALIQHERNNANLVLKTENMSFGKIAYLTNSNTSSKAPIVMLHGFGGEKDNWDRFSKKLTGDYPIIIPDLPGHGESVQDFALTYGVEEQAKRLKLFLDAVGVKKAHLVGNSMGGAIGIRFAYLYPQSTESLTLIASAGAITTPSEFDAFVNATGKNPILDIKNAKDFDDMSKFLFEDPPYLPGFVVDILVEQKKVRNAIERKMLGEFFADMDQTSVLPAIQSPTLIIWGAKDKIINVKNAELLHQKITGSKKEVLEEVGHCPMIEKPDVTAALYRKFLAETK